MKKVIYLIFTALLSSFCFSNSLTIHLEDANTPCIIYVNGGSVGEVRDSIILTDLDQGSYKISMFSELAFDKTKKDEDYAMKGLGLTQYERNLKKYDSAAMQNIINKGTETIFLTKNGVQNITIKNKMVNDMLRERDMIGWICLGGSCLGLTGLTGCLLILAILP